MDYSSVLLPLAIILVLSKALTKFCERLGLPSVVGMLLTGVIIGFINFIPSQNILTAESLEGLGFIAKIGVILIMFSAGLETDTNQMKAVGAPAFFITISGVLLPLGLGFGVSALFNGGFVNMSKDAILTNVFYGVILTATSVSVSVATLKELGKLSTKVGSTVITAAILDDLIGIIILSFVISLKDNGSNSNNPFTVLLMTVLFFIFAFVVGYVIHKVFKRLDQRYPHHRLIPVLSLGVCFFFSYVSEAWFGVADITGAFAAGLVLSKNPDAKYIDRRSDIMSYMIFTPIFFANIGITSDFSGITVSALLFGAAFILAGIIGKVFGCGVTSKLCGYSTKDSLRVGIGMMARAEVALVSAQKGLEHGLIDSSIIPFIVILIIVTSFITPIALKALYKKKPQLA